MFKMYENLKIINIITNVISAIVFSCPYTVNVCEELDYSVKNLNQINKPNNSSFQTKISQHCVRVFGFL